MTFEEELKFKTIESSLAAVTRERDELYERLSIVNSILADLTAGWPELELTPQCERILQVLYRRSTRECCTKEAIMAAMYINRPDADWCDVKIVDVQLCRIRKVMPEGSIETVWGRGYRMTEKGKKFLDAKLKRAA